MHFQDVLCGYYTPGNSDEMLLAQKVFGEALNDFRYNGARTLKCHESDHFCVYTNSYKDDLYQTKGLVSYFVGHASGLSSVVGHKRKIAQFFGSSPQFQSLDIYNFIDSRFSGVLITPDSCHLFTDYFGKKKLFYKQFGSTIFFSNEFRTLAFIPCDDKAINQQALREYLTFGAIIGNHTIFSAIHSVPLQGYIEFTNSKISSHRWKGPIETPEANAVLSTEGVFKAIKETLIYATQDLGFKYAELSGGADSRLNMSLAEKLDIPLEYTTNCKELDKNENHFYDYEVVKLLSEKFHLKIKNEIIGPYRSNYKVMTTEFDLQRQFDGDVHAHLLTGMFGGELLAAWSFDCFRVFLDFPDQLVPDEICKNFLSKILGADFESKTVSPEEHFRIESDSLQFSDPRLLLATYLTYSSQLFYRSGLLFWLEPYLISNRKFSIFLSDALLREVGRAPCLQELRNYMFYRKLYLHYFPESVKIPFNSEIANSSFSEISHINQIRTFSKTNIAGKPPPGESIAKHEMQKRYELLNRWLDLFEKKENLEKKLRREKKKSEE